VTSATTPLPTAWHPDELGDGWSARTIDLPPDRFGPAVATLVHREPTDPAAPRPRRAVLHVHGFVDYFFQRHLGDAFAAAGWDFYALDLRDYGRSIRPGREPNYTTDIAVYAQELDRAVELLKAEHDLVVIHAHSMGGLIVPLWANERPGLLDALVLNSPWLDHNGSRFERGPLTVMLDVLGRVAPRLKVRELPPYYGMALHVASGGEWDYNLAFKPHRSFPVRAGWIRSIRAGHHRVARGLDIRVPMLVLASGASSSGDHPHDELLTTDVVVDVRDIAARAPGLGTDVTFVQIPGGAHDLSLSPSPAREQYIATVLDWLAAHFPA